MAQDPGHRPLTGDYYTRHFTREGGADGDTFVLNMGPQHPATHGVLRVIVELDGEYIRRAEPVLGYVHRMHEKMGEVRTYVQYLPNMGRVDYLHALAWNWAYVGAVEKLAGIRVPERAEVIRVITCELNRISSHLLWWGAYLLDLGAFTPIVYAFADRERIMDLLQTVTGARLTYCYFRFGGVARDVDDRFVEATRGFVADFRKRLPMYRDLVTDNVILRGRCEGIGVLTPETARGYGATGPVLRGSGVAYDVRRAEPYSVYDRFEFYIPVGKAGDAMDRYEVRMEEMAQSLRIIEQGLDRLPAGAHIAPDLPERLLPPRGEVYHAVEGARGKIGVYLVSDGGPKPYRVKLRAPGFSNLSLFAELARGTLLADAVSILGSLDLVIPEIDR
jgi:NADH-quinone oxidoreductase subunit D